MARKPTWIAVVAAAMRDDEGRFLLQRRPLDKEHGGLWEFPGGKVEGGESPRNGLVRELNEELSIMADDASATPLAFAESEPSGSRPGIVILLYEVTAWSGEPVPEPGSDLGWFAPESIDELPLPPLDSALLAAILGRAQ
ncbi:(deoxy)nucleoside triphosphate pyrophosphohydrolase [Tsuneonella sp. HG094]